MYSWWIHRTTTHSHYPANGCQAAKYLPVVFKACAEPPLVLDQTGTWIDAIVWGWQLILRDQSDLRELELVLCHLGDGRLLRCELSIIGIIHRAPTRAWLLPELFL